MGLIRIDHVQLAMPAGSEDLARAFYRDALGLSEVAKPASLARRGGCWFGDGALKVHLGVDPDFQPARKAHPAFLVDDLAGLIARLEAGGHPIVEDAPIEGQARIFTADPFGNRIELIERAAKAS